MNELPVVGMGAYQKAFVEDIKESVSLNGAKEFGGGLDMES